MNFMTILMKVLKNPRSILGMGMVLILFLVFVLGPKIGLVGWKRLAALAVLLVLFVVIQVILAARAKKKKKKMAEDLETSMIIEADQSVVLAPDSEKAARENARRELQAAIQVLKDSRLGGGKGGKAALYVLPWFMVMGTEESAKGEIIRHSGLQRPDQGPGDLVGIGSSANCEWWFTNQAVILEADRRFASKSEEKSAQRNWETFLELLGKHHSQTPLNGLVITISATELLQGDTKEIRERARLLRRRLDAMRESLRQLFPVYVMVTKMDLLLGFHDYFSNISSEAASQIWGATFRQTGLSRGWSAKVYSQEFDLLSRALGKRRQMCLVREENLAVKEGTYLFPLEFKSLRSPLECFLSALCEENAYGTNPLVRGFYFVATGEGGPVADVVLNEVSQIIGLPGRDFTASRSRTMPSGRPFFLKDFFRKVLIPDRHIARQTQGAAQQARVLRRTLQYTALTAMVLFAVLLSVSFGRNMALINRTKLLTTTAENVVLASDDLKSINQSLRELDNLKDHLVHLDELEDRRPLTLDLGLYRGNKIKGPALEVYLQRLQDVLVIPSRKELTLLLELPLPLMDDEEAGTIFYNRYRAYRTLFTPHQGDAELIANELGDLWAGLGSPSSGESGARGRVDQHIRFAMKHADVFGRFCGTKQADRDLIRKGNQFVRDTWRPENFYHRMVNDINKMAVSFKLDATRHPGLISVGPEGSTGGRVTVPGSFTRVGWTDHVRNRIINSDSELKDDWLLQEVFEDRSSGIMNRLLGFYERDYKRYWSEFLESVELPVESDLGIVAGDMDELLDEDSPFLRLLAEASENLRFKEKEDVGGRPVVKTMEQIESAFVSLHTFVRNEKSDDGNEPQADFRAGVMGIRTKLWELHGEDDEAATMEFTKSVFDDPNKENPFSILRDFAYNHSNPIRLGSAESNRALQVYLTRPAEAAWRTCLEVTTEYLDAQWQEKVWKRYSSTLNLKYPCFNTATDATTVDYSDFFGPGGALTGFLDKEMSSFLEDDQSPGKVYGLGLALGPESIQAIRKAKQLAAVLFHEGKLHAECTLTAQQLETISGIAPNFGASLIKVGHQSLIYKWGSPKKMKFEWPNEAGDVIGRVAVICLEGGCQKPGENQVPKSEWALFRLLDMADLPSLNQQDDSFNIKWVQSFEDRYKIAVPYHLKAKSQHHPFKKDFLRFSCPESLRD
jgi:type VI secretion system protein ImpL